MTRPSDDEPVPTRSTNDDGAFDHGAVSRFNAWFFTAFAGYGNLISRSHKRAAFAGLASDTILEIARGWVFEGCSPPRDTPRAMSDAGFSDVHVERRKFRRSLFWPINTAAWGIATR